MTRAHLATLVALGLAVAVLLVLGVALGHALAAGAGGGVVALAVARMMRADERRLRAASQHVVEVLARDQERREAAAALLERETTELSERIARETRADLDERARRGGGE